MSNKRPSCLVAWCDQGTRPHTHHEVTLGTWRGQTRTPPLRPVDAQIVIHGYSSGDAGPMLALIDSADMSQLDCELEWAQIAALSRSLDQATAAWHHTSGAAPHTRKEDP